MQNVCNTVTAIPNAELNPRPVDEMSAWAGTLPGVMAGKRPPQGSPRVDFACKAESSHWGLAIGAEHVGAVADYGSERAVVLQ
jgi:hypothetical protein